MKLFFKRKPEDMEREKSLEELQREYYESGADFHHIYAEVLKGMVGALFIIAIVVGIVMGISVVGYFIAPPPQAVYQPINYPVVEAIITGEDVDCVWVMLIDEDGGWEERCTPKHKDAVPKTDSFLRIIREDTEDCEVKVWYNETGCGCALVDDDINAHCECRAEGLEISCWIVEDTLKPQISQNTTHKPYYDFFQMYYDYDYGGIKTRFFCTNLILVQKSKNK